MDFDLGTDGAWRVFELNPGSGEGLLGFWTLPSKRRQLPGVCGSGDLDLIETLDLERNIDAMIDIDTHPLCPHRKKQLGDPSIELKRYIKTSNILRRDRQPLFIYNNRIAAHLSGQRGGGGIPEVWFLPKRVVKMKIVWIRRSFGWVLGFFRRLRYLGEGIFVLGRWRREDQ